MLPKTWEDTLAESEECLREKGGSKCKQWIANDRGSESWKTILHTLSGDIKKGTLGKEGVQLHYPVHHTDYTSPACPFYPSQQHTPPYHKPHHVSHWPQPTDHIPVSTSKS